MFHPPAVMDSTLAVPSDPVTNPLMQIPSHSLAPDRYRLQSVTSLQISFTLVQRLVIRFSAVFTFFLCVSSAGSNMNSLAV